MNILVILLVLFRFHAINCLNIMLYAQKTLTLFTNTLSDYELDAPEYRCGIGSFA